MSESAKGVIKCNKGWKKCLSSVGNETTLYQTLIIALMIQCGFSRKCVHSVSRKYCVLCMFLTDQMWRSAVANLLTCFFFFFFTRKGGVLMLRVAFIVSNNTNIVFNTIIVKNHCCSITTPYQIWLLCMVMHFKDYNVLKHGNTKNLFLLHLYYFSFYYLLFLLQICFTAIVVFVKIYYYYYYYY